MHTKTYLMAAPERTKSGKTRNTGKCVHCGESIYFTKSGGGYWDHGTWRGDATTQRCSGKALRKMQTAPAPLTCSCGDKFNTFQGLEVHYFSTHITTVKL